MNMPQAMRPAYAHRNAPGICTYVRTDVLTKNLSYVGDESCVGNACEHGNKFGQIFGTQAAWRYAHCRPDRREGHGNDIEGTWVGPEPENANQPENSARTETL